MAGINFLFAVCGIIGGFGACWLFLGVRGARAARLAADAQNQLANASGYSSGLKEQLDMLTDELAHLRQELMLAKEKAASLEAERKALDQRLREKPQEIEQLKTVFQNSANVIFEHFSTKFSTHSEKQIGTLLDPLKNNLNEFKKLVGDSFATQGKEHHTLKNEIEKIVLQTDSLTKALRGDVKAQGNWGEVILERILEESGLEQGIGYIIQGSELGLSDADGNRQRPDVIVNLPDNKHIIIDAKVSLTAYERYCGEADEVARALHLKDFLRSIKTHVTGLEQRRYQDIDKLGTPDFVLMFMPIEGAYSLALQSDTELHHFAWGKRIVLVCPSTLFATLQTVASLWRIEKQNKHAEEIAAQAGKLYDKFDGFVRDMLGIGDKIDGLQKIYDGALNKLKSGRGNLVDGMEKLKQLGAKTTKSLSLQSDGAIADEEEDEPQKKNQAIS